MKRDKCRTTEFVEFFYSFFVFFFFFFFFFSFCLLFRDAASHLLSINLAGESSLATRFVRIFYLKMEDTKAENVSSFSGMHVSRRIS